jgi:hypothetical protein
MHARVQRLRAEDWDLEYLTKKKPEIKSNFTIPLLEIEKYREGGNDYYKLLISHDKLRKHYRPNFGDGTVTYEPDPFEQSYVWKMTKQILENKSLESYPPYITKAVQESTEIGKKGKEYFEGGKYTYLSGRTDAIHHFASPFISQAQKELDSEYGKGEAKLPTSFPLRWLMQTPELERKGNHNLQLKCILSGTRIDSEHVNGKSLWLQEDVQDSDEDDDGLEDADDAYEVFVDDSATAEDIRKAKEAEREKKERLKNAPRSTEDYTYEFDCYPPLRRCTRLGLNMQDNWQYLPMIQKIRKMDYTDKVYPDSSIKEYVGIVKGDAEAELLRAIQVAGGHKKKKSREPIAGTEQERRAGGGSSSGQQTRPRSDGEGGGKKKRTKKSKSAVVPLPQHPVQTPPTSSLVRISERPISDSQPR